MIRLKHYLTRKRSTRSFIAALVLAVLVLPTAEALAYFSSTGTGTATAVAGTTSTVTLYQDTSSPITYGGPSTTNLMPGGTASIPLAAKCLTGACPAFVSTVNLAGWTSDKTGCDSTTMPGSFTMPALAWNNNVVAAGTPIGSAVITWVNLSTDQSKCAGATFTFTFTTP